MAIKDKLANLEDVKEVHDHIVENILLESTTEPAAGKHNRVWINPNGGAEYEIPTYDEHAQLANALDATMNAENIKFIGWEQGNAYENPSDHHINYVNGSAIRCRLLSTTINPMIKTIEAKPGYLFSWYACTYNGSYYTVIKSGTVVTSADVSAYSGQYYIVISVRKENGDATITPTEATNNITYTFKLMDLINNIKNSTNQYTVKFAYGETPEAPYDDFNTFPVNETICVFANTIFEHSPDSAILMLVKTVQAGPSVKMQEAYPMVNPQTTKPTIVSYFRYNYGYGWSEWQPQINDILTMRGARIGYSPGVTPAAPYDDTNTFPVNSIVLAYKNRNVQHLPTATGNVFTIMTLCGVEGLVTAWQLGVDISNAKVYSRVCYTIVNSVYQWTDWREIGADGSGGETFVTVDPSDNLVEAIESAYLAGHTTIIVNGGTHNILNEYGITNEASSYPSSFDFYGPKFGNYCKIIGKNGAKLEAIYTGSVDDVKTHFSILNIISDCEIIGLDMEVTNVRYCIHDDPNNLYHDNRPGYRVVYEDCTMNHNGSNGSYSAPACIGAGTTQQSEHVINRCNFTSPSSYENAVTYHNNSGSLTAKVTITNCVFAADNTIRLYALETSGSYVNALVCGNYLGIAMNIVPSDTDRFNIVSFNNVIAEGG